ncbi:hypothetical protein EAH80_18920 [Mycobacterium hodleri]|uniref:Uncharacterized protein n=1 Tax=Mycolicibacterium hodleri TaxID=49897 RepID=A0A502E671_9MYCO|nr:hypothetical protein EAH80_18920 [Mycolicibacterium hodleri]
MATLVLLPAQSQVLEAESPLPRAQVLTLSDRLLSLLDTRVRNGQRGYSKVRVFAVLQMDPAPSFASKDWVTLFDMHPDSATRG